MTTERKLSDRAATVVLAGGQGTRLFPLTQNRCKPAVAFGGRYRLIDIPISNSLNANIRQIYVISQYFATELLQHIHATYHFDQFEKKQFEMLCPEETPEGKSWFKGTADAIRQNLHHILESPADYFLILSGDQLYNIPLLDMVQFAIEKKADFVIAALKVNIDEAKRMGLLKIDGNSIVTDFYEKPQDPEILRSYEFEKPGQYLGSMGIYVFHRDALESILKEELGDDFGRHVIPPQVKKRRVAAYQYDGYWEDIGTIASYFNANLALTDSRPALDMYSDANPIYTRSYNLPSPMIKDTQVKSSFISQGAIIEAKEVTHSVIGIRTRIKSGTIIRHSIILGNHFYHPPLHQNLPKEFTIGNDCLIENAIIDEHTLIGNNVQLTNRKKVQNYDGDGIYIRDGIIIVTTGTCLPDGFIL